MGHDKGGARRALPLFALGLALAAAPALLRCDPLQPTSSGLGSATSDSASAPSPSSSGPSSDQTAPSSNALGSLDAGGRLLYTEPMVLDGRPGALGFPKTSGLWLMWGGGATLAPSPVRVQLSAWHGALSAGDGAGDTSWTLNLAALTAEQVYPVEDFLLTVGASLEGGQLDGSLLRGPQLEGVDAGLFGYSAQVGLRWPAQTPLGVFARGGWEELYGPGVWHGPASIGGQLFELGGPTATLQLELNL